MSIVVVSLFMLTARPHAIIWHVTLALGARPAFVILLLPHDFPETAVWLVRRGRFREAKRVSESMHGDKLDMLPDADVPVTRAAAAAFLADTRRDPVRWRATLYGWIACFCQGGEFSTFAFYLPVLFLSVGVSSLLGTHLVLILLYSLAAMSGWIAPLLLPRPARARRG